MTTGIHIQSGDITEETLEVISKSIVDIVQTSLMHHKDITIKALESLSKKLDAGVHHNEFKDFNVKFGNSEGEE